MATLRKKRTQNGYHYIIDFTFQGKRHVITSKTSDHRLAKRILHDIEGKIARGTFKLDEYQEKHINISDFAKLYFENAESYKRPSTISLERIVVNNLVRCIGDRDLRDIDIETLDDWKRQRLLEIKPATYNLEVRTLKAFLNIAKRWEYLSTNPFTEVTKLKVEDKRLYMTDNEIRLFIETLVVIREASRTRERRAKLLLCLHFYEFLLNTGLRREEGTSLELAEVDLDLKQLHIMKTKDKEARDVPLTKRAIEILEHIGNDLFSGLSNNYVTKTFTRTCKQAKLTGFKLHSLRHTFATRLIDLGIDVLTVSKILGHSDISTTMIYAKVRRETMQKAVDQLEKRDSLVTIRLLRGATEGEEGGRLDERC